MAYIGAEPVPGQNREVDDISSGFNGNATAFTLQVSSVNVSPESAKNILVNLGGVLQNPDTDYTINASTITFTTAPAAGLSFFGLILGAGINTATVADGAITTAKLANDAVGANQLANTSVTAGSYTTADITVDAQGRVTAAASGTIANAEIADGAITNAKVNASAAIARTKLANVDVVDDTSPQLGGDLASNGNDILMADNDVIKVGTGSDLQIDHDSGTSQNIIQAAAITRFRTNSLFSFQNSDGSEAILKGTPDAAVELFHNGLVRLATVSEGVEVKHSTGDTQIHFNRIIANAGQTFFIDHTATGQDFKIRTSDSSGLDTTALQILGSGCLYNVCKSTSQSSLTLRKDNVNANGIDYLQCRRTDNQLKLAIAGTGDVTNVNNSYGAISDIKLKENIVDANSQWSDIKAVKIRNFNFIADSAKTKMLGVVAQEIETVSAGLINESIDRDPDTSEDLGTTTKNVKYSILYMKAIKALQEAMTRIETLETKVAALEAA